MSWRAFFKKTPPLKQSVDRASSFHLLAMHAYSARGCLTRLGPKVIGGRLGPRHWEYERLCDRRPTGQPPACPSTRMKFWCRMQSARLLYAVCIALLSNTFDASVVRSDAPAFRTGGSSKPNGVDSQPGGARPGQEAAASTETTWCFETAPGGGGGRTRQY